MKDNISLRILETKDAPHMLEWLLDSEMSVYFRFDTLGSTMDSVLSFIKKSQDIEIDANFAIVDTDDEYLGTISLKSIDKTAKSAEYAISLRKKAQGKGYGYLATVKILDYAFDTLGLERVFLNVLSSNVNAISFYEKFGFVYEGEFVNHISIRDEAQSLKWFRLMKHEYKKIREFNGAITISDVKVIEFPELGDERGHLVVVEGGRNVPFEIKRIFYIYGSDSSVIRGQHANKRSAFCLINVCGKSKVRVADSIGNEKVFDIDRPHMGLYIPKMIWKDMYDFSSDSILLVLSNEHYDGTEYIRDWTKFFNGGKYGGE
jgi:RimJ/RimL family protein N-acetyltransferase